MQAPQVLLEQPRLRVHPEQDREIFPGVAVGEILPLHFLGDELRFFAVVRRFDQPHLFSAFAARSRASSGGAADCS